MQCKDGTFCNVKSDSKGYKCCIEHQGRAKCPKNKPMMCENKRCDGKTDHCCSDKGCGGKYGGQKRCQIEEEETEIEENGNLVVRSNLINDKYINNKTTLLLIIAC